MNKIGVFKMNKIIMITKEEVKQYLLVVILTILSVGIICLVNDRVVHICVMWLFAVCAILIKKIDVMHPYIWFSMILTLYSTAYSILLSMGVSGNYTYEQLMYPTIALGVALFFIGPRTENNYKVQFLMERNNDDADYYYFDAVIIVLFVICLFLSLMLLRSGLVGKTEMKQSGNIFYRIGVYAIRYLILFSTVRVCNRIRLDKKYIWCFVISGIAAIVFAFSTGERDAYIRLFVIVLFVLYSAGVIKKRHFFVLIPVSMVLLALSVEFKYYFLRGTLNGSFSLGNVVEGFLSSDFSAAGRNLQYLIDRPWTKSNFGFGMLFTELLYPILPSSLVINPDSWFNYVVHDRGYHGNAFTLVGTGYIICGVFGVVILFTIVGLIVKWLYRRSKKNIFYYSAYIYSITIIMVSLRGSLNSIMNSLLKEVGICFLFCYFANRILSIRARTELGVNKWGLYAK